MSAPFTIKLFTTITISCLFFIMGCSTQKNVTHTANIDLVNHNEEKNTSADESSYCFSCHKKLNITPHLNLEWQSDKHAISNIGCKDCHTVFSEIYGTEKELFQKKETLCSDKSVERYVSPKVCGHCHKKQYGEFVQSSHFSSWDSIVDFQKNVSFLTKDILNSCESCHTIQFKCNSCHIQHTSNTAHMKSPAVCGSCHTGSDHPQYEIYVTSKHGMASTAIQSSIGNNYETTSVSTPSCVTCHMPEGAHNTRLGLYRKIAVRDLPYLDKEMKSIKEDVLGEKENDMLALCNKCHAPGFSKNALIIAKNAEKELSDLLKEAEALVMELNNEKLLLPALTLSLDSIYPNHAYFVKGNLSHNAISKAENIYIRLTKHHATIARKALHHMNANYVYSNCWQEIQDDLQELRNEANKLRQEAEINRKMRIKLR